MWVRVEHGAGGFVGEGGERQPPRCVILHHQIPVLLIKSPFFSSASNRRLLRHQIAVFSCIKSPFVLASNTRSVVHQIPVLKVSSRHFSGTKSLFFQKSIRRFWSSIKSPFFIIKSSILPFLIFPGAHASWCKSRRLEKMVC